MKLDEANVEKVARAICDVWGYIWDGDPDEDEQVAPEVATAYDTRPDKRLYREAARAVLRAIDPPTGDAG
jgi:hypothetical protein